MRQASWILFLLTALGLVGYEAIVDGQETTVVEQRTPAMPLDGTIPTPRP
jgi:hypothetical protein